ncbi:hypothetical protein BDW72DRAFT_172021 [Aspergillus terricola var. indicus]
MQSPATAYREASPEFQVWALPVTHLEFAVESQLSIGEPPDPPLRCHEAVTESNPEYYHVPNSPGVAAGGRQNHGTPYLSLECFGRDR